MLAAPRVHHEDSRRFFNQQRPDHDWKGKLYEMPHLGGGYEADALAHKIIGDAAFRVRGKLAQPQSKALDEPASRRVLLVLVIFVASQILQDRPFLSLFLI